MSRPRSQDAEPVPVDHPDAEECSVCALSWASADFVHRLGRCTNCARALYRSQADRRGSIRLQELGDMMGTARERALADQKGACAICRFQFGTTRDASPRLDHDHVTGSFRGFLCHGCNVGLGFFVDDPERLRSAIAYVESHRALEPEWAHRRLGVRLGGADLPALHEDVLGALTQLMPAVVALSDGSFCAQYAAGAVRRAVLREKAKMCRVAQDQGDRLSASIDTWTPQENTDLVKLVGEFKARTSWRLAENREQLVSGRQAAIRLGVSDPTVYRWLKNGTLPHVSGRVKMGTIARIIQVAAGQRVVGAHVKTAAAFLRVEEK